MKKIGIEYRLSILPALRQQATAGPDDNDLTEIVFNPYQQRKAAQMWRRRRHWVIRLLDWVRPC